MDCCEAVVTELVDDVELDEVVDDVDDVNNDAVEAAVSDEVLMCSPLKKFDVADELALPFDSESSTILFRIITQAFLMFSDSPTIVTHLSGKEKSVHF